MSLSPWDQLCQDLESTNASHATLYDERLDALRNALNKDTADGNLPSYELRKRQQQLSSFEAAARPTRPKSQFSFSRKTLNVNSQSQSHAKPPSSTPSTPSAAATTAAPVASTSKVGEYLDTSTLRFEVHQDAALQLSDCTDCVIDLAQSSPISTAFIGSLHCQRLDGCLIRLPNIAASLLVYNCKNCYFVAVSCHQVRLHHSNQLTILADIATTPVLEECSNVTIGPAPSSMEVSTQTFHPQEARDFDDPANRASARAWSYIPAISVSSLQRDPQGRVQVRESIAAVSAQVSEAKEQATK